MNIKQKIKMDLISKQNVQTIHAVHGDTNSRYIEISLFECGVPWKVPENSQIAISYLAANGANGIYDTLPNGADAYIYGENKITIILVPSALYPGTTKVTVVISDENYNQISTFPLNVEVDENYSYGASEPETYINLRQWIAETLSEEVSKVIGVVRYDGEQTLTEEEKAQARANIGAAEAGTGGSGGGTGTDGFSPVANVTQTDTGAVITITDKSGTTTATIVNGKDGSDGQPGKDGYTPQKGIDYFDGKDGLNGKDGVDGYTPVKGVDYFDGAPGKDGVDGKDGAKGDKGDKGDTGAQGNPGKDGADGKDGANGKDGVSATHSWNGTTLTITSASGTSSANLKGEKGEKGPKGDTGSQGPKGDKGDPGIVGPMGEPGPAGSDGRTPVRGVDYYTEADKTEFSTYIASELAKRGQLKPEFANSIEECTDTTKLYVLPDGMIYAYILTEVESGPAYTNLLFTSTDTDRTTIFNGTGYKTGVRLSGSSGVESSSPNNLNQGISGFITAKPGDKLYVSNFESPSGVASYVIGYNDANAVTGNVQNASWMVSTQYPDYVEYELTSSVLGNFTAIRLCLNGLDGGTIATLNEEITEGGGTTTGYAWVSTGHAFVPADYEDRIVALENEVDDLKESVNGGVSVVDKSTMFISPDGDDNNSGLTSSAPKKTVQACVSAGAKRISAKRGVYNEIVQLSNIGELEILPTDNDLTYAVGVKREPIVFDTSDSIAVSSLAAYNSIKRVAYSNPANTQFDKVFTKQSQTPLYGGDYGSRYNSTVWLLSEDEKAVCIKLKPVLTVAECEAEANTFSYVDGYIYINADMTSVGKVIVPTNWGTGFYINGADRLVLKEVEVHFAGSYNIDIRNCAYFDFYKCSCKYTSYGSGFHPFNSNGKLTACYATKNYDGYGVSGYGHTTYVDCVSEFNFDDGVSHHNGTEGTFIGGRYEGNGKGGNTPAYGARVNIYGGLYKDNASFGIGYLWATDLEPASGMVQGAVMVGNPVGLSVQKNCVVTAMNCTYQGNTSDKDVKGNLTEYNANYVKSVNGVLPDENGNVEIEVSGGEDGGNANLLHSAINSDGTEYVGANGEDGYKA